MTRKNFSDAMNEIDDRYITEAVTYKRKSRRRILLSAAACLCLLTVTGALLAGSGLLSRKGGSTADYAMQAPALYGSGGAAAPMEITEEGYSYAAEKADEEAPAPAANDMSLMTAETAAAAEAEALINATTKIVYTASVSMETMEFDEAAAALQQAVEALGGYFENSTVQNNYNGYRSGEYRVRIPAAAFSSFCESLNRDYRVTYFSSNAEDISDTYYDTQSRLDTARAKLTRLQELLTQAENMEDIITIQSYISDTEYEIEYLSGNMKHYDAMVNFSTVTLDLREVYKYADIPDAPITLGERMNTAFRNGLTAMGDFLEGTAVFLAYSWLWILLLGGAATAVVLIVKKRHRK